MVAFRCAQSVGGYTQQLIFYNNGWSGGTPQVGDMAIGVFAYYPPGSGAYITPPAGWNALYDTTAVSGTNNVRILTCYKELTAGDIGTNWIFTSPSTWYHASTICVYTPANIHTYAHEVTNQYYYADGSGPQSPADYGNWAHPALTLTKQCLVVLPCAVMRNNSTIENGPIPFGNSSGVTTAPIGAYMHGATYMGSLIHHVQRDPGAVPRYQVSNYATVGTFGVGAIALTEKNATPVATIVSPDGIAADPRQPITWDWTYSDTEGNPQTKYQLRWRLRGTSTWTEGPEVTSSVSQHTWAANEFTLTLGNEYEWAVRVSDAVAGWGAYSATAWFMAGAGIWVYSANTASATQGSKIPAASLTPGKRYYFEVRTADAQGFGPWSAEPGKEFLFAPDGIPLVTLVNPSPNDVEPSSGVIDFQYTVNRAQITQVAVRRRRIT